VINRDLAQNQKHICAIKKKKYYWMRFILKRVNKRNLVIRNRLVFLKNPQPFFNVFNVLVDSLSSDVLSKPTLLHVAFGFFYISNFDYP